MIKRGDPIPPGPLMRLMGGTIETLDPRALYGSGRHVIVGVVGAFTPVCGVSHLPEFMRLYDTLMAFGKTNSITSICVTDPFVVDAWGHSLGCDGKIALYADPVAAFTEQCGLSAEYGAIGMGKRSVRYILIFNEGVVERITVEPDPFKVEETSAKALISAEG